MPRTSLRDREVRRAVARHLSGAAAAPSPSITVAGSVATIVFHSRRDDGAVAVLGLAERVGALFRGRRIGVACFGAPSVDLDGRDPDRFRAIVTLPFRCQPAGRGPKQRSRRPP